MWKATANEAGQGSLHGDAVARGLVGTDRAAEPAAFLACFDGGPWRS
jgi:hypothetical protein